LLLGPGIALTSHAAADPLVERGRYLVRASGCNDCHTPDYRQKNGEVPERDWLTGDATGWRGPWGTTYATNLRLYLEPFSEDQWLTVARNKPSRPPMPWYALRDMQDSDLRALYRYIRQLGPAGNSAPGYVPPGQEPSTSYISLVPVTPSAQSPAAPRAEPQAKQDTNPETKEKNQKGDFWDFDFKPAPPRMDRP
jgi:hypothetical protein